MKLVNIVGPLGLFDEVVRNCVVDSGFAPEHVMEFVGSSGELLPFPMRNPSSSLLSRALSRLDKLDIEPCYHNFTADQCDEGVITAYFDELSDRYQNLTARQDQCRRAMEDDEQILKQLDSIMDVRANLDDLFNLHYAKLRVGRIPREIYENYARYLEENPEVYFFPTGDSPEYVYGMYVTPASISGKSDALFSSLHFERIHISGKAHGSPAEARQGLEDDMAHQQQQLEEAQKELDAMRQQEKDVYKRQDLG